MKMCTGERYTGQFHTMINIEGWHGKFGHVNVLELDHESYITGYGKHDRVVAFIAENNQCYVRVDHVWELGMPTEKEILKVMRKDSEIKGRWKILSLEKESDGSSTHITFIKE